MISNLKSASTRYLTYRLGKNELNGLLRCWRAILNRRGLFSLAVLASVAMAFFEGGSIALLGMAVAVVTGGAVAGNVLNKLVDNAELIVGSLNQGDLFIFLVVVAVFMQVVRSGLSYCSTISSQYLVTLIRGDLTLEATKLTMEMSYTSISSYPAGQIVTVVEQTKVLALLVGQAIKVIRASVMLLTYCSLIIITSPYSAVIILLAIIILWLSVGKIVRNLRATANREVEGELAFPEGFEPKGLEVVAKSTGKNAKTVEKKFGWLVEEV